MYLWKLPLNQLFQGHKNIKKLVDQGSLIIAYVDVAKKHTIEH